jgi:phosphonate transport system permease protein
MRRWAGLLTIVLLGCWSAAGLDANPMRLVSGGPEIAALAARMLPPNLALLPSLVQPLIETLEMALVGTTIAALLALPMALLAANNTSPHPAIAQAVRLLAAFLRTMPDLIWAMLLVSAIGLGPFPGVLALILHAVGGLTKFYYEAIEASVAEKQEALAALGAGRLQIIVFAILPEIRTALLTSTLLYWEYNNRASTVLGLVGAGGIGFVLTQAMQEFRYRDAMTCLIVIVAVLFVIDVVGVALRRRVS